MPPPFSGIRGDEKTDQDDHDRNQGSQGTISFEETSFLRGAMFGDDLVDQAFRRGDAPEFFAEDILAGTVGLEPAGEFRVLAGQSQSFSNLRVFRIAGAMPIG